MKTELDSAWESAIHNAERARKAEAEIERLQAELAEAKKFKDGMLDVLGGACPNDHRSTPFEEFKGCTPCLRDELAALQQMYTAQGLTIKRQQDELAECRRQSVSLYNSGYHAGHHDTVEGCYTHILPCDMSTYHDDVVAALREGGE